MVLPPEAPHFNCRAGLGIMHECCPVILECKRTPSRQAEGQGRERALMVLIEEAQNDLEHQCAYAFKKYSYSLSLMAIVSAGNHWSYAHVPFYMVPSMEDVYGAPPSQWDEVVWSNVVRVGSASSNADLAHIRHYLVENKTRNPIDNQ